MLVEGELGVAIYSWPEVVPVNGITPVPITAMEWPDGWFRWLGINMEIHWFYSDANLGWIRLALRFRQNGDSWARRR